MCGLFLEDDRKHLLLSLVNTIKFLNDDAQIVLIYIWYISYSQPTDLNGLIIINWI